MATDAVNLPAAGIAVPDNDTLVVPVPALWVKVRLPVLAPVVWGVNLAHIEHVPAGAIAAPQSLRWAKSVADTARLLTARLPVPVLVTVNKVSADCCATSVAKNATEVGDTEIAGTPAPLPVRPAVAGTVAPVQFALSVPVRLPVLLGENAKLAVHVAPAESVVGQL